MKAFYCGFEIDYKENSYFNLQVAGEKIQVMRYDRLGVKLRKFFCPSAEPQVGGSSVHGPYSRTENAK